MPIEFRCSQCGKLLRTGDETVGREAQCPACGAVTTVPEAGTPVAPPPAYESQPGGESAPGSPFRIDPTAAVNSDNPYESPFAANYPFQSGMADPMAAQRIAGPATWLLILGILGAVGQVFSLLVNLANLHLVHDVGQANQRPEVLIGLLPSILLGAFGLAMSGLLIVGSLKMKNLENYALAMTAAVIAVIPCVSPCCIFTLPFGIWAIITLNDSSIKAAFRG